MARSGRNVKISHELYLKIHELSGEGMSSVEIAQRIGKPEFDVLEALLLEFDEFDKAESLKQAQRRIKKESKKEVSLRDVQIVELRKKGLTFEEIGNLMGVSRERIRQVINSVEIEIDLDEVKRNRQKEVLLKQNVENRKIFQLISENWNEYKSKSLSFLALEFGIPESKLGKCISRIQYVYLKANQEYTTLKAWTDSKCLESLVNASTYAFPLTVLRYRQLLEEKTIDGPTVAIFIQRFGSWANACALAGVEFGEAQREYDRTWSDKELLRFVRRFMFEREDGRWSIEKYEEWRKRPEVDGPSVGLLRLYISSWSEIRVLALELNAPEFDMNKFSELRLDEE
jgi:DNA-binding CsgD family transcriptional regulator